MVYLQTDRSADHLLGASYAGAVFAIHAIDARGVVAEQPTQVTATPPHTHCIVPDPENRYLFVTSLGGDAILQYLYDAAAGRAVPNDPPFRRTPTGSGPRHLIFHPTACVVYVNGELDGSIGVYAFDQASGRLEEIQHVGIMPADGGAALPWGADLHLTADGRHLYASERRTSTLAVFAVRAGSGLLDRRQSIATETQPRSFAIEPSGRFLFAAGEKSGRLAMYERDSASGGLRLCGSYPVGEKPGWVSVAAVAS
jgi:6-phosphogluconolactonase